MRKIPSHTISHTSLMCNKTLKLLASLIGVIGASILIGLPVEAQQSSGGATNPRPSIFNEPPYNRRTGTPPTTPTTPPSETQPPETAPSPVTPAPGATEPSTENLVALAAANDSFKTLTAALKAAGLTETLSGQGPFTVFAPTDAAFAQLPQDALQELLKPENKDILVKILTYHVVPGNVTSSDLKSGEVKTVEGGAVNVQADPSKGVSVNDASVVQPDIKASNGVIHAIDKVMLPPDL
nr:fasciclin domain-containing protein [Chroococcidiopsis sp. CCALA 051]